MAQTVKKNGNKVLKWVGISLGALVLLLVLLPFTLYIPWVQNVAKNYACRWASEATGMEISIDRILIEFPLDVSVDGVLILDQQRDTMVQAANLTAGVAFMPLLKLQVEVDEAQLTDGYYKMHAEDSSMHLKARVNHALVKGIEVDLNKNAVSVSDALLRGGDVSLDYLPYMAVEKPDTAATAPWHVEMGKIALEQVNYSMRMLPAIDRLTTYVARAELNNGVVDTGDKIVDVKSLEIDSVDCRYYYLSEADARAYDASHPPVSDVHYEKADSLPWRVTGHHLNLTNGSAVYAVAGKSPADGLDMNHLALTGVNIELDSLINEGIKTSLCIRQLTARERCGLDLRSGKGFVALDENSITARGVELKTMMSELRVDAYLDNSFLDSRNPTGRANVNTDMSIALQEVAQAMPAMRPVLGNIPQYKPLTVTGSMSGSPQMMMIDNLVANLPGYARAQVGGNVYNVMDMNRLAGDIDFDVDIANVDFVKPTLMDMAMRKQVDIPPMSLTGNASFGGGEYSGAGRVKLATGELLADGRFSGSAERYRLDATMNSFPVNRFLPKMGVGELTGHIMLEGNGLDISRPTTSVNARVDMASVGYNGTVYRDLYADVRLSNGAASGTLRSYNKNCDIDMDFSGSISGNEYRFMAEGAIKDLNLNALGLYKGECYGRMNLAAQGVVNLKTMNNDVTLDVTNMNWHFDGDEFFTNSARATFFSADSVVRATLDNEDTQLRFAADCGVDTLLSRFKRSADIAMMQVDKKWINIDTLQQALPPFNLSLDMGYNGLVQRYARKYNVNFKDATMRVRNDTTINIHGAVSSLLYGTTQIDTLTIHATEYKNKYLAFAVHMGNKPGTWDEFATVDVHGGVLGSTVDFLVEQRNIKGQQGYRVGLNAKLDKDMIDVRLFPKEPVIGYRKWSVNDGNYVNVNYVNLDMNANLRLQSDSSAVAVTTVPNEARGRDDIRVQLENIILEEWMQLLPFVPEVKGRADADIMLTYDGKQIWGDGSVKLSDLVYERRKIGDMALVSKLTFDPATGNVNLNADMELNGSKVAFAYGTLNDTTASSPLNVSLKMDRFPLDKVSPFIPGRLIRLRGYVNGDLSVKGTMDKPILNGFIEPDSARVYLPRYGSQLRFSQTRVPMENSVIKFNNLGVIGINDNQVTMNGAVDISDLSNMLIDLRLNGRNVQFVGSEQRRFSEVFGKGFADLSATVKGDGKSIKVRADVALLPASNITYVLKEDVSTITKTGNREMVTFINMNDTTTATSAEQPLPSSTAIDVQANVRIEEGAKLNAYISEDGNDLLNIVGNGNLKYSLDFAGKDNLVGRLIVESGRVRYSPPVISTVNFEFDPGSYIEWTGQLMNPKLHISGSEKKRTSVTNTDGGSRLVDFLIKLNVGNTLSNMDLKFDLEAGNDAAVANDLQTMTEQQRSTAAMNMLLYGSYQGVNQSSSGGFSTSGALNSFLASQLNSWAAKSLKGVDLNFGINQYDAGTNGRSKTETSYSYRLSKSLFNDRFKIVIGGEYSTDASSEENFSKNLISDISFEYHLSESGNQYVHLFRHTGYESVLEGRITTTGVGYVIKRKLYDLRHLFRRNKQAPLPQPEAGEAVKPTAVKPEHASDSLKEKSASEQ